MNYELIKEAVIIYVVEVLGYGDEEEACQVVTGGIVRGPELCGQPGLILGDGLELRLAEGHHTRPVARGRAVEAEDVQLIDARFCALPQLEHLRVADVVDVEGEDAVRMGVRLLAVAGGEGGLPADAGKPAFRGGVLV